MSRYPRALFVLLAVSMALLPPVPFTIAQTTAEDTPAAAKDKAADEACTVDLTPYIGVDPQTGELSFQRVDLAPLSSQLSLAFSRTYRSREPNRGALGSGWMHTWEERIETLSDGSKIWWKGDGVPVTLAPAADDAWISSQGAPVGLRKITGAWLLTDHEQMVRTFQEQTGRLMSVHNAAGRRVVLSYEQNQLRYVTDEVGRTLEFVYAHGLLSEVRGPLGWQVAVQRGRTGQASVVTTPVLAESYDYDDSGRLLAVRPAGKRGLEISYDNANRAVTLGGPATLARTYSYSADDEGVRNTRVDAVGLGATQYRYAADGQESVTDPLGQTVEITRDVRGLARKVRVPGSGVFVMDYDARADLVSVSNPLGHKVAIQYDDAHRPVKLTDARGKIYGFEYDAQGNLARTVRPDTTAIQFGYNAQGRVERVQDPAGGAWRYAYDEFGNLASVVDATGAEFHYRHDALGRLLEARTPGGAQIRYEYDAAGRVTAVGEGERLVRMEYDAAGALVAVASPTGERTVLSRGPQGAISGVRNALGGTATLGYDDLGRLVSASDATGRAHRYEYDVLGRVKAITDPAGQTRTYAYNPLGMVAGIRERDETETRLEYDPVGRLTRMAMADGDEVRFSYDAAGNPTRVTDKDSELVLAYDDLGRLSTIHDAVLDVDVKQEYDAAGRLTAVVTPWGKIGYGYDAAGRVTSVTPPVGEAIKIQRNADGLPSAIQYPNGQVTRFERDPAGRVLSAATMPKRGEPKLIQAVEFDARGFPSSEERDGERRVYQYDDAGRLVSNGAGASFRRDAAGRPITETSGGTETAYSYDQAGRVVRRGDVQYDHDVRGRMTRRETLDGVDSFRWDSGDRLTGATLADGTQVSYKYDALGRQVARSTNDDQVRFLNLGPARLAAVGANGQPLALYVQGPGLDQPVAVISGNDKQSSTPAGGAAARSILYLHPDADGDVVAVTDGEGNITRRFDYDPFGRPLADAPSGDLMPFGFRGRPWEPGLRWWDMRARHLDPALGTFTSEDPMGLAASGDLYAYSCNNPNVLSDPSGAIPIPLITGAVGAVIGAATYAVPKLWDSTQGREMNWNWGDFGARTAGGFVTGAAAPLIAGALGAPAAMAAGSWLLAGAGYFAAGAASEVMGMVTEDLAGFFLGSSRALFRDPMDYVAGGLVGGAFGAAFAPFTPLGKALDGLKLFGRNLGGRKPSASNLYNLALKWGKANAANLGTQDAIVNGLKELSKTGLAALFGSGRPGAGEFGGQGAGDMPAATTARTVEQYIQDLDDTLSGKGKTDIDSGYERLMTATADFTAAMQLQRMLLIDQERKLRLILSTENPTAEQAAAIQAQLDALAQARSSLAKLEADLLARAAAVTSKAEATGEVSAPSSGPAVQPR